MRAIRIRESIDPERLVRASMAAVRDYSEGGGDPSRAVLVIQVRELVEEEKENGAGPQRKTRPR